MLSKFKISSSECLTCNNELLKNLGKIQGVFGAEIDRIDGSINVNHTDEASNESIIQSLENLGISAKLDKDDLEYDQASIWGCAL